MTTSPGTDPVINPLTPLLRKGEFSFSIQVFEKDRGKRLDQFLSQTHLSLTRSRAKRLIEAGNIVLNERQAKPSSRVRTGDRVSGFLPQPEPPVLKAEALPLSILYEDSSIIVVDKPAGMVVHPAAGNPSGTLVNALLYHCRDLTGINGVLRPGIVHRLDKDTSGVMVVAKNQEAYRQLAKQFKERSLEKVYLAIAYGRFGKDEGLIDSLIGRHPTERKKMSTRTKKGRPAVTSWRVAERLTGFTFLEIYPRTGRTHQIRVHFASVGHPILGDRVYGRMGRHGAIHDPSLQECLKRTHRHALHAHRLIISHPRTGERMEFNAPMPRDMNDVLECLRSVSSYEHP